MPETAAARGQEAQEIDWPRIDGVLFVRLRSIGDTVLMTPCLKALKSWRPDIKVTVASEPLAAPLLEGHPLVDRLVICGRSLGSRVRLIKDMRRLRFGLAVNLHGGSTATLITALSGAKTTAGYSGYSYSWMQTIRVVSPDQVLGREQIHSVEQQLALLQWCGVPVPAPVSLQLPVCDRAAQSVHEKLAGLDRFAVISPAAAFESKQWPAESYAAISDYAARSKNLPCVVIAGPGQEQIAENVARHSTSRPRVITGLTMTELVALLASSSIFIGNDSGPMHIAAAFDRPIVAVFGASNPKVWHPWTRAKWSIPCCDVGGNPAPSGGSFKRAGDLIGPALESIKLIPVDAVIQSVDDVLSN
ncbi:MAG: glycosyltransferase family 9 protein [Blastocatellia bacterium]